MKDIKDNNTKQNIDESVKLEGQNEKACVGRRKLAYAFIIIGCLLVAAAAGIWTYNEIENRMSVKKSGEIVKLMKDGTGEISKSDSGMNRVRIMDEEYIGYLYFPTLDEEFPIADEWSYEALKTSPCRYYGALETHDLVIAGHNYREGFGQIKQLKVGDPVQFVDVYGNVYNFEVVTTEILQPTQVEDMITSPYDLSLYTCTYRGTVRYTVRCAKPKEGPIREISY